MTQRISAVDMAKAWTSAKWREALASLAPSTKIGGSGKTPSLDPVPTPKLFGNPEQGEALLAGRYIFGGQMVDVGPQGHPFTISLPSERFADWLHSFDWLPDLLSVKGGGPKAAELTAHWCAAFDGKNDFVFAPDQLARRLCLWGWALDTIAPLQPPSDPVRPHYAAQMRMLKRLTTRLSPGLSAMRGQAAMVLFGARQSGNSPGRQDPWFAKGLDGLDEEIEDQILPDGGHVTRSPSQMFEALRLLSLTDRLLQDRGLEGSKALSRALDRIAPMVATMTHMDGGLGLFHGGHEGNVKQISALLTLVQDHVQPFAYGPHTGYHRLDGSRSTLLIDTQDVAERPFDKDAHLAPLALEISTPEGRLIVNCGWHPGASPAWRRPVRASAAHSTLTLADRSPGQIVSEGLKARILGPVVEIAPGNVRARRKEQPTGIWLETSHDGYKETFGLVHRRRIFMGEDGDDIRGEDSLFVPVGATPIRTDQIPFTIRFHFHPDVRVSLAQDLSSALLVLKGRAGWRFRTDGGPLAVEPSVYLGRSARPVRAQQLVISGAAYGDGDGQGRDNRVRWSLRRLSNRKASQS